MGVLSELEPKGVFRYFEEISSIPRGSYHEKEISDYLVAFAKAHHLEYWQDDIYNVVMKVPASQGREKDDPIILQGHMDMVCEHTKDADIDMDKEGLRLAIDGNYVYARETTLGGDDGIAVAYMLAIADDNSISHPELEYIITVSEEVGMDGASQIDLSMLRGNQMLNLDSEEEGIFLCSCAGGLSAISQIPMEREASGNLTWIRICVDGLLGGHSGCEIDKERGNASILLGRVLYKIREDIDFSIADIYGGKKDNAIPVMAEALIGVAEDDVEKVVTVCETMDRVLKAEYAASDEGVRVSAIRLETGLKDVLIQEDRDKLLSLLMTLPNGVMAMSMSVSGLVETSLNLGIMKLEKNHFHLQQAIRSSVTSRKYYIADRVRALVTSFGGSMEIHGEYPAWEYKEESVVRPKVMELYRKMFQKEPVMEGIHAGLECGLLAGKIKDLDCVSMGPDILDIHTTSERLSISSTKRMYDFLIAYLNK